MIARHFTRRTRRGKSTRPAAGRLEPDPSPSGKKEMIEPPPALRRSKGTFLFDRSRRGSNQVVMDQAEAPRALIVEDHGTTREVLRRLLRVCGYEAEAVATLAEAENRLHSADRMFLDLELADGNGIELLRRIRSQNLPIRVAVTTGSSETPLLAEVS